MMPMNIEVLSAQFEAHKQECATDKATMLSDIKEIRAALDGKVSFKHFYWIIGILVTIQMAVLGYIIMQNKDLAQKIEDINKTSVATQIDMSVVKATLNNYDIKINK